MKKKIVALALAVATVCSLRGCGEQIENLVEKELEKIIVDIKAEEKKRRERENTAKLEKIEALVSELSYENKIKLFWELTNDPDIIVNVLSKSGISVERINTCCREILK